MIAFKYKSLRKFNHVADILSKKQFYASPFFKLNDPMEGLFKYDPIFTKKQYIKEIKDAKGRSLICSFSKESTNILLWSYYADGCRGICIEVDINDVQSYGCEIKTVNYSNSPISIPNDTVHLDPNIATTILSQKYKAWKHEKEIRILSPNKYIREGVSVRSVLIGLRISNDRKNEICRITPSGIPIYETYLDKTEIKKGALLNANSLGQFHFKF
ncbi:MAG: DUF2971 domain-containing protein [Planctomycetota bacterium]